MNTCPNKRLNLHFKIRAGTVGLFENAAFSQAPMHVNRLLLLVVENSESVSFAKPDMVSGFLSEI